MVAIVVFCVAFHRTYEDDFKFKFDCDVTRLNQHKNEKNTSEFYDVSQGKYIKSATIRLGKGANKLCRTNK